MLRHHVRLVDESCQAVADGDRYRGERGNHRTVEQLEVTVEAEEVPIKGCLGGLYSKNE
jgi:hypothetical protein